MDWLHLFHTFMVGMFPTKAITDNCGLIDLLEPGDIVTADKGYDIQDLPCT